MADGIISNLETAHFNVRKVIDDEGAAAGHNQLESLYKEDKETTLYEENVPVGLPSDLETHLENTFQAFYTDKSGFKNM